VAITLDNVAETHLARGNGNAAAKYLYSTLNHATPLYTWCEERGQEPGTTKCSGDRQHLWTPVAVVRAIRDMLVLENGDGLDLALGTDPDWLGSGKLVGIQDASTHFGIISYELCYDSATSAVTGKIILDNKFPPKWVEMHIRLPEGLKVKSVDPASGATVTENMNSIKWNKPRGNIKFRAKMGL